MDATNSAVLHEISSKLDALRYLKQSPFPLNLSQQFFGAIFTTSGAIFVALFIEKIKRNTQKSHLVPGRILAVRQGGVYHYRLPITNESDFAAKKVEINLEKIIDPDGSTREIVSTPFDWTHREEVRDIFPHQTALLNICEVKQEEGKFIRLRAVRIMELDEMVLLKKGISEIAIKYYQENGQTGEIKLKVTWNGNETFNQEDLPIIAVEKG